jgi:hypothetical protein
MKEEDYVMMLMSTYGTLSREGKERYRRVGVQRITFQYPELVYNHFQYRDAVDSHNARRMAPIALGGNMANKAVGKQDLLLLDCKDGGQLQLWRKRVWRDGMDPTAARIPSTTCQGSYL